ncbi:hypothetical protein JCM33374_g3837 [Metschnikowia sp. JCM 33374]|nr:hypothetical protein JCM33374_g3837 [Metschnikowia sp. JCM 33374]
MVGIYKRPHTGSTKMDFDNIHSGTNAGEIHSGISSKDSEDKEEDESSDSSDFQSEDESIAERFSLHLWGMAENPAQKTEKIFAYALRKMTKLKKTKKTIKPRVLEYINNMEYPMVLAGEIEITPVHPRIKALGKMTKEEKPLFQYVNTVLQSPVCRSIAKAFWDKFTRASYKNPIRVYVSFLAKEKVQQYKVNGELMVKCMKEVIKQDEETPHPNLKLITQLDTFQHALESLQLCIAIHKASQATYSKERGQILRAQRRIPDIRDFEYYQDNREEEAARLSKNKYRNKAIFGLHKEYYSHEEALRMMDKMWHLTGGSGENDVADGINAPLEFLLNHSLIYEDKDRRMLNISDAVYTHEKTSRGTIPILGFELSHRAPFDANGKPECMGVCRNKEVELCLISAFAFSLWYRFDFPGSSLSGAGLPDFKDNAWLDIKLLFSDSKASHSTAEVSQDYEGQLMETCLESIGRKGSWGIQLKRDGLHSNPEVKGIAEHGLLWSGSPLGTGHSVLYPPTYPYDLIHFLGGFKQYEPYYIARDVEPPVQLLKMIFPWVEDKLSELENATDKNGVSCSEKYEVGVRFLKMLQQLRPIIIQDLAVRMEKSPAGVFSSF